MSRSETSSLPASRARTPSPLSTHRVNHQRHACTPSPRLSLRILPTSLSTCSSTVSSSNAPVSTAIPSSSYHPFSCPHLDYSKAVKRASGVSSSSSRSRGAAYEMALVRPDYSSAFSAERESMYYSTAAAKLILAKSSEAPEPVKVAADRSRDSSSFERTGNLVGAAVVTNSMSNVRHVSLPASVLNSVLTAGNTDAADNTGQEAGRNNAATVNATADSYVHFAQSEELLYASDAQTLCSKMDVAAVSHDYAYPNLPAESTSREVNRLRDVDSQSTSGRLTNLSQYGVGSSAASKYASQQRYGSGDTLASSRVNNNRPSHGESRSTDRLNTISLQHFDRPSNDAIIGFAQRDNRSTTSVKKLEIRVGNRHHSYPQIEQQGVMNKSTNRSIVSFQQSPESAASRLSTVQLSISAANASAGADSKRREKKTKTKKLVVPATSSRRAQCKDCNEFFDVARNPRGSCPDAPDECAACIKRVSCVCCVHAALYHCARDEDGQYEPICSCHGGGGTGGSRRRNCRKWTLLTVLALCVPCLWCFLPMMACHDCCVKRHLSGARHREK